MMNMMMINMVMKVMMVVSIIIIIFIIMFTFIIIMFIIIIMFLKLWRSSFSYTLLDPTGHAEDAMSYRRDKRC